MKNFIPFVIEVAGLLVVLFFFWIVTILLMKDGKEEHRRKGFRDFIIGDSNRYSPIRLQTVAWAIIIISSNVAIIIALVVGKAPNGLRAYQPVFPETILWLLGLSLTSYVSMKGIDLNKLNHNTLAIQQSPKWSDLITSYNGLDFGRFQMLIWTVIGLLLFFFYNVDFIATIMAKTDNKELQRFFNTDTPEFTEHFPSLSKTFLVLMGISQGSYLGKNLLPEKNDGTLNVDDIMLKFPNPLTAEEGKTITLKFETKPAGQPIDVRINDVESLCSAASPMEFPFTPSKSGKVLINATAINSPSVIRHFEINVSAAQVPA